MLSQSTIIALIVLLSGGDVLHYSSAAAEKAPRTSTAWFRARLDLHDQHAECARSLMILANIFSTFIGYLTVRGSFSGDCLTDSEGSHEGDLSEVWSRCIGSSMSHTSRQQKVAIAVQYLGNLGIGSTRRLRKKESISYPKLLKWVLVTFYKLNSRVT